MKICFFTDTFLPIVGGAELVLHHLALQLSAENQLVVLAPRSRRKGNRAALPYPVLRYIPPLSKRLMVRQTLPYLLWLYLRHRFDLLHCHAAYPQAYVGAAFKKWIQVPMVVRPHGSDIVPGGRMRRHPRIEKRVKSGLATADAIVAQGRYLQKLVTDLGVDPKRIHIIHNGVGFKEFGDAAPFPHPRPYMLAVGSLIKRKGFDILLHAYSCLPDPKPDLLIAGTGPEASPLRRLAQALHVQRRVFFLGLIKGPEKVSLYRSSLCLVCPSRKEPFANVIIEALAAQLPVIASAVDGNRELIQHQQNGLLFESENANDLCRSLRLLLESNSMAARMGVNAREAAKAYDWAIIARQYLNLYHQLLSPPLPKGP